MPGWGSLASKKKKKPTKTKKPQLPVTYIEEYMDFFPTVQLLVDIRGETYYKLFTWPHYWKWYFMVFYSNKTWIALYVGMAHFVWVTLVGLLVLEIAFIFWALGMANLEAVQDVWWDNLHNFVWKDSPVQLFHSGAGVLASATCWKVEAPLCVYGALI